MNSKFGDVLNSQGVLCCPMAHPLQVGFVLDQSTCWCDMHCDGCDGSCTCAQSLSPGQTVWFCDNQCAGSSWETASSFVRHAWGMAMIPMGTCHALMMPLLILCVRQLARLESCIRKSESGRARIAC